MHIERERREGDREILHNALSMLLLLKTQCDYDNVAAKHWGIMLSSRNPSVEMKDCLTAPTPTWEMENYFVNIKSNKNKKRLVLLGWYCSCWFIVWFFFFFPSEHSHKQTKGKIEDSNQGLWWSMALRVKCNSVYSLLTLASTTFRRERNIESGL